MKKIILIISLFFLITLNNSFSAPIKVLGIDVTMDKQTAKDILTKQNFETFYEKKNETFDEQKLVELSLSIKEN